MRNPRKVYAVPGIYTVSLTVSGPAGTSNQTEVDLIHVLPPLPVPVPALPDVTGAVPTLPQPPELPGLADLPVRVLATWNRRLPDPPVDVRA